MNKTLRAIADRYRVSLEPPYPIRLNAKRTDLPALCRSIGFTRGAEVGVWKGAFSKLFCDTGMDWICVDPWESYPEYSDNKNNQHEISEAYLQALATLGPLGATFICKPSLEGAAYVPDGSLDVCYLDGNHTEPFVRADVETWTPKVRRGGLVCGHDYRVNPKKPFIQVKQAIDRHVAEQKIAPWFIFAGDNSPSFMWVQE